MNQQERTQALALIQKLWADWKPTDEQLDVFSSRLERVEYSQAIQAIRTAYAGPAGRFNKPQLSAIMEAMPAGPAGQSRHSGLHDGHPGMYIQCVEGPHRGDFKTLYWPRDDAIPEQHRLLAIMETFRADHERLYGGTWQLVRSMQGPVTEAEMMARMFQLRGTVPFDEQRAGKKPEAEYQGTPTRENSRAVPVRQVVKDFMAGIGPQTGTPIDQARELQAKSAEARRKITQDGRSTA